MAMKLKLNTAKGAMSVVLRQEFMDQARSMGMTEKEYNMVIGSKSWEGKERHIVKRCLENILYACVDSMGLARFALPAEFAAACIASFVYPTNYFAACSWLGNFHRADELGNFDGSVMTATDGLEKCSAQQLFALVLEIVSEDECALMARRFMEKTECLTGFPLEQGDNNEKKK